MRKIVVRSVLALLVIVALIGVGLAAWDPLTAARHAPPTPRAYDAEIVRDEFGVPHIFGRTDADVAFGVAWAHAEDDFDTLQQVVALARGELGTLEGAEGAQGDFVWHLLDIQGTVEREYGGIPADVRAMLDAYATGLNAYAQKNPEEVRRSALFPVNGQDIAAGFAVRLPFFFGLQDVIGPLASGEPMRAEGGPPLDGRPHGPSLSALRPSLSAINGPDGALNGSNAFAVSPLRSKDGVTHLVSNAHQPWRGGVAWYELVVESEEGLHFAGGDLPRLPFPFLGHNDNLGWTNTVNRPDLVDVYGLTRDQSGERYRLDDQWLPLETKRVWLKVSWGPFTLPVPQTIQRSRHGPVLTNDQGAFAIRYAGMGRLDAIEQYYRLPKARDFAEWQQEMARQGVPATNFIYADRAGNIAYFYNALFPNRRAGVNWRGIVPGDRSDLIWPGPVPWDQVPRLINPASGYIMNANNTPFVAAGPGDEIDPARVSPLLGVELDMTNRARRAIALFEATDRIGRAEIEAIKYDKGYERSGYARAFFDRIAALDLSGEPDMAQAQALLGRWDWATDGKGVGDALAVLLLRPANSAHYQRRDPPDPRDELENAATHLRAHFGTLDPPLGELLRLRQGDVDLPLLGGSDTLRCMTLWDVEDDGRLAVRHGDSFLMFMEWDAAGQVSSRSIMPFGAATTRPTSRHYADQAPLFAAQRTKPVHFSRTQLMPHASHLTRLRHRPRSDSTH